MAFINRLCTSFRTTSKLAFLFSILTLNILLTQQQSSSSSSSSTQKMSTLPIKHQESQSTNSNATAADNEAVKIINNNSNNETPTYKNTLKDDLEYEEFIDGFSNQPHSRKKRLIWITDDGRLALPPGTSLTFTPTIALPLVRHPPEGFFSNVSISFPVTIDFDKLGLTDNQNPLGDLPPIFARSFGHAAGEMLGNYVARYLHYKKKRELTEKQNSQMYKSNSQFQIKQDRKKKKYPNEIPELPERFKHIFHGGERVMLYGVVEDFLSTFGMDGRACLLRVICEVHARNLHNFGVFGEIAKLFLTVTKSPFAKLLPEYVRAQQIGEGQVAPGECFPYHKECPKSIFKTLQNRQYSASSQIHSEYNEQEAEEIYSSHLPLHNQQQKTKDKDGMHINEIWDRNRLISM